MKKVFSRRRKRRVFVICAQVSSRIICGIYFKKFALKRQWSYIRYFYEMLSQLSELRPYQSCRIIIITYNRDFLSNEIASVLHSDMGITLIDILYVLPVDDQLRHTWGRAEWIIIYVHDKLDLLLIRRTFPQYVCLICYPARVSYVSLYNVLNVLELIIHK